MNVRIYAPWHDLEFPNGDLYVYDDSPISARSKAHYYRWERNTKT